jgi:hypothetical protein
VSSVSFLLPQLSTIYYELFSGSGELTLFQFFCYRVQMTVQRQNHSNGRWWSSPKGCRKLAGDNIPGHHAIMTSRPGGAPEQLRQFKVLKVIKGFPIRSQIHPNKGLLSHTKPNKAFLPPPGGRGILYGPSFHPHPARLGRWRLARPSHLCALCASVAKIQPINQPKVTRFSPYLKPTEPTKNRVKLNQIKPKK